MKRTVLTFAALIGLSKAISAIRKHKARSKKDIGRAFTGVLK